VAESKEYSWAWVTADRLLTDKECELVYALLVPSSSATCRARIYDGENTSGDTVVDLRTAQSNPVPFKPEPVYCRRGLYVDCVTDNVLGVFVQWRHL